MVCKNAENQYICSRLNPRVPCCEEICGYPPPSTDAPKTSVESGLVVQLFEMGKELVERQAINFRAEGVCMSPLIRPGDRLHIEPRCHGAQDSAAQMRKSYEGGERLLLSAFPLNIA